MTHPGGEIVSPYLRIKKIPEGTTIYSAMVLHRRIWGLRTRREAMLEVLGRYDGGTHSYDACASQLSTSIFRDLTPLQILMRHSSFGFYSRALDSTAAECWARDLIEGEKGTCWKRHLRLPPNTRILKTSLSYCLACASEDLHRYGYALWRVVHQIEGVCTCPVHGFLLITHCATCGAELDRGNRWRLPTDPCPSCEALPLLGRGTPFAGALGEAEFSADCGALFMGHLEKLRPLQWAVLIRTMVCTCGLRMAIRMVEDELRRSWGGRRASRDMAAVCGLRSGGVANEFGLLALPGEIRARVAVWGALRRLGFSKLADIDSPPDARRTTQDLIEQGLATHALPLGLSQQLLDRVPVTRIAEHAHISAHPISEAVLSMSSNVRAEITRVDLPWRALPRLPSGRRASDAERTRAYRQKVLWALKHWDRPRRIDLAHYMPQVWSFLHKNDRAWLDKHKPARIYRGDARWGEGTSAWGADPHKGADRRRGKQTAHS